MSITSTTPVQIETLNVPPRIKTALRTFVEDLEKQAADNLSGIILYGGLASGHYQFDRSDINVIVLLKDPSIARIKEISQILRNGLIAARIEAMLITPDEVRKSTDTFPTKFLHIQSKHMVLSGTDPFVSLSVPRNLLRLRVEQELRNDVLRLRRIFVNSQDDSYRLAAVLGKMVSSLEIQLSTLLFLAGVELPESTTFATITEAASRKFGLDEEALLKISEYRRKQFDVDNVPQIYSRVLASLVTAADVADAME